VHHHIGSSQGRVFFSLPDSPHHHCRIHHITTAGNKPSQQSHLADAAIPLSCPASIFLLFSSSQTEPDLLSLSIN
jgi:hypothetical protein